MPALHARRPHDRASRLAALGLLLCAVLAAAGLTAVIGEVRGRHGARPVAEQMTAPSAPVRS